MTETFHLTPTQFLQHVQRNLESSKVTQKELAEKLQSNKTAISTALKDANANPVLLQEIYMYLTGGRNTVTTETRITIKVGGGDGSST